MKLKISMFRRNSRYQQFDANEDEFYAVSDSTVHERDEQRVSPVDAARKNNIVLSVTGKPSLPATSATMASTRSKFIIQIFLTLGFFFCEFITSQITKSDTLLADAFHMLSDFIALSLGFFVNELANVKNVNPKYTFGYGRAEVVGAFANAIFLAALTFDIILDAIDRFILVPTQIKNPEILMAVGILGLVINICGLIMFCSCDIGHGHSHEGFSHGHSHGGADEENLNMKAVALHLLGDAFGSIIVMVSAGIILAYEDSECSYIHTHQVVNGSMPLPSEVNLTETLFDKNLTETRHRNGCWVYYLDPVLSLLISILILWSVVPIIKRSSMILLEACSKKHINVKSIQTQLTAMVGSSQSTDLPWTFTDLKVWDLNPSNTYCCVTIQFYQLPEDAISSEFNTITSYMESINSTQRSIKTVLEANYRIHHIILNQEFKRVNTRSEIPSLEKLLDDRKYLSDDDSNSGERDTIAMHDVGHGHSH